MFKKQQERGTVLGVCVTPASFTGQSGALDYRAVDSGRRAIDMLRLVRCDLLLVNLNLPDISIWNFLRHIKTNWPQQKWALVGSPLSTDQEITARMFNPCTFFDVAPSIQEVCGWETLSDVKASAQKTPAPETVSTEIDIPEPAAGTNFDRLKRAPQFEITRSRPAHGAQSSYGKKAPFAAV